MAYESLYGMDDIRTFDFDVYILEHSASNELNATGNFNSLSVDKNISKLLDKSQFQEIGKLDRAVTYTTETGETIVDNEGTENLIDRVASVSFEHISANNDVKTIMRKLDGKKLILLFVSKSGYKYHCVLFPSLRYSYEESSTSGTVSRLPFNASRDVARVNEFRLVTSFDTTPITTP